MIIPLRQHRDGRVEGAQVLVEEVIFVVRAEFGQRFGDLRLLLENDVLPHAAVGQLHLGRDGAVGIDRVPRMDEEIRAVPQHGLVDLHAAAALVDAPALARSVARPDKADVAAICGGGAKAPDHRLAGAVDVDQVLRSHPVEDVLAGWQVLNQGLHREVTLRQRVNEDRSVNGLERVAGRKVEKHPGRSVDPRPDDARIRRHVARLQAMGDDRAAGGAAEIGKNAVGERRETGGTAGGQEMAPAEERTSRARHG